MLSHDQMAFAITKLYPDLIHGQDFWVAHLVKTGLDEQTGEAEIVKWQPENIKQPDYKILFKTFKAHADEFRAQRAKAARLARLQASDWTQLADVPTDIREKWVQCRQALRDLPQQEGYPAQIAWPARPGGIPTSPPESSPEPEKPAPTLPPTPPSRPGQPPRRPGMPPPPFDLPE
jgi:hypothetical protein